MVALPALTAAVNKSPCGAKAAFNSCTSVVKRYLSEGLEPGPAAGYSQLEIKLMTILEASFFHR
jgi:hypothetical protein